MYSVSHPYTKQVFFLILSCLLFLSPQYLQAQSFLRTQGKAIVNAQGDTVILRGMGLGGWMLQEGYMLQTAGFANAQYQIKEKIAQLIGNADMEQFYDAWLANHCRKIDIDSLASWGFNSVRLPMHYNIFTLPIEDEPVPGQNTWLTKGFELTDSLISWCRQNNMYVILDLHAAPGGQGYDQGISDYDPTKPSLWESKANRDKCVALWKKLAERYANEPVVAGYDLLNEPNWNLPGGTLLRSLYEEITDSIRTVDNKHILIIEGNWFANDFTGLTPPWDTNLVYSPHKYWSFNFQQDIQWVLDIREAHDVPLYLGESGENSNTWFRDAIRLLEDHEIGWAWWPMKKVEAIAGPLSVTKTPEYQSLLDYWNNGGTPPTQSFGKNALMDLAEKLKIENCRYQKDVTDAMFRQVYSNETVPYRIQSIPGRVHASDFDMGRAGHAYFDTDLATYHVSTGSYTAWNQGWAYRNDGVDLEPSADPTGNGYSIGWIADGEWMNYAVDIGSRAVYDIKVRVASQGGGGFFRFSLDGAYVSRPLYVPNTGGWQVWQDLTLTDVVLDAGRHSLRFNAHEGGFNLSGFEFIQKGAVNTIDADFLFAQTLDENTIELTLNKPMAGPLPAAPADFQVLVDNVSVPISQLKLSADNARVFHVQVNHSFDPEENIRITYQGNQILAMDGSTLQTFIRKTVQNTIPQVFPVPGRVEAEGFFFQSGVDLENTFDTGGGKNIGNLDVGDYLDYYIDVDRAGFFDVAYRTAATSETGQVQLQLIDSNGAFRVLQTVEFAPTGDWQTWATTHKNVFLNSGLKHIRIAVIKPAFNMNWFEFTSLTSLEPAVLAPKIKLYPNPGTGQYYLQASLSQAQNIQLQISDTQGKILLVREVAAPQAWLYPLDLRDFAQGAYILSLRMKDAVLTKKIIKW